MCENQGRTVSVTLDTTGVLDRRVLVDVRVIGGTATGKIYINCFDEMTFFTVGNDFTLSTSQLVFEQFSGGERSRGVTIRAVLDSVSEGSETILLEASAGDWPFTIGENSTTVTINECSAGTYVEDLQLAKFSVMIILCRKPVFSSISKW